ncbi:uncharacterized protein B0P05DRAFT_529778 [Gilbertella persicaria]|uniref:uncharacterized protein n=1 Tax=Gilbertella persicaria TaxID=101096 RepID=UPI00222090EC|nr:uncharacterized protein B0P05DRAFT_529778 [Gilbertella persicaria]KAI8090203.1 hypothetical protein B0P05DRAFT_529778 [Gilbertella persicaria]
MTTTVTTAIFSPSDDESNYRSSLLLRNEQNDMHLLNIPSNLPKNKLSLNTVRSTELLSASRPKLHTKHSSDTYRLPTLERLENAAGLSRNAKITVEPVSFAENSASNMTKGTGSQSDVKSVRSFNGSINNSKKKHIKHKKKSHHSTPTEVFAKNLSEAVLDVDDSCDGYVYHTPYKLYPPLSPPISPFDLTANSNRLSTSCNDDSGSYFSDCHRQKPRRPGLRSAVSELPAGGTIKPYYFDLLAIKLEKHGLHRGFRYRCSSSEDEDNDEESTPLLYYSGKKDVHRNTRSLLWKKESRSRRSKLKSRTCFWWLTTVSLSCFVLCFIMILLASPLHSVEIFSVGNVLGTQKQLMIDLYVRARNSNSWNIQVSHAAISLFAASHYVPTIAQGTGNTTAHEKTNNKQEYLGTLNKLDDPLIFEASPLFYFNSKLSTPASHIQIKNPGEAKDDVSGNERWSLLIRYPYELTLRGVLRYQLFPFFHTKTYSARVCKVVHVNPATGAVGEAPLPEQSICDED